MHGGMITQRAPENLFRGRRVLDQLDEIVAEYHAARRHGQIDADLERGFVGHRDASTLGVGRQVRQALRERRAAGFQRELDRIRVGGEKIRRRDRIDILTHDELETLLGRGVRLRKLR